MGGAASRARLEELFRGMCGVGGRFLRALWVIPSCQSTSTKQGRNLLTYTEQAISRAPRNRGYVVPSGLAIRVETRQAAIDQVRIVPHASHYTRGGHL